MNKVTALAILVLVYNNIILCSYIKPDINARAFKMPHKCNKEKVRFCFESDMIYPTDFIDGVFENKNIIIEWLNDDTTITTTTTPLMVQLFAGDPLVPECDIKSAMEWQNDGKKIMGTNMLRTRDPLVPECDTKSAMRRIVYYVLDDKNETRVVVNSAKYKFEQRLDFMECMKEGPTNSTEHFFEHYLSKAGVNMNCKNVYLPVDLVVLKKGFEADFEIITLTMPVFCKAYIN